MKVTIKILAIFLVAWYSRATVAQEYTLYSPDGHICLTVTTDEGIRWSVKYDDIPVILPSSLGMDLSTGKIPGDNSRIRKDDISKVDEVVVPVVPVKDSKIEDIHNELLLSFRNNFSLKFRAYNDGIAYRFETNYKENVIVMNESAEINFMSGSRSWYPLEESFMSHNERSYIQTSLDTINESHLASLPVLVRSSGVNVLITETALEDYPGMWVRGNNANSLRSVFPFYPKEVRMIRDRNERVVSTTDFIAETEGTRSFPWRVFLISPDDAGLVESNLTYLLSDTSRIGDASWVRPGKVAWDWWNANNIYGVDFRAGLNNDTYKYYIDFASENGIEYVILDEGWYVLGDLFNISPGFDIKELCDYAAERNVGIILWVVWKTFDNQMDAALDQFEEWGVKGVKVDFMQRDDQKMVEYYGKVARKAAEHKMMVDFHGAYKPSGLRRTYPNVITREGVKGLEHDKWSKDITPGHDATLPFIRMAAGPMDYTPGAMVNLGKANFNPMYTRPASQGTRVHQMALYVTFESPLQMLADNPSNYKKEQVCTDFIVKVPVTWDETRVLEASVGEYLVVARRKGDDWFIGGITDWSDREFDLDLSFLGSDMYDAVIFNDGINADRYASDYSREEKTISGSETLKIKMAPGGGWVARFRKK